MRVHRTFFGYDRQMKLVRGGLAQQYVPGRGIRLRQSAEISAIKKGCNPLQIFTAKSIASGNPVRFSKVCQSLNHNADTIQPCTRASSTQLERDANKTKRASRNRRPHISFHQDNGSKDHCPAKRVRPGN